MEKQGRASTPLQEQRQASYEGFTATDREYNQSEHTDTGEELNTHSRFLKNTFKKLFSRFLEGHWEPITSAQ